MVTEHAELAVDRDEELRLGHGDQSLQLAPLGVPAHVHLGESRVDHFDAESAETVDDLADGGFVARNGMARQDDGVVVAEFHEPVLSRGHE